MLGMKAVRGAGWLIFSRFAGRAIDFITLPILARILTPTDFGITALAMTLVVIVDTVFEMPVTQALVRLEKVERVHFDTGFTISVIRSLSVLAIVLIVVWPFSQFYREARLIPLVLALAIGPLMRGLYSPKMVLFVRELSFRQTFLAEFCGKLCAFPAAITVALCGGGYWAIAVNFVLAPVVATLVSYLLAPYRPWLSMAKLVDFAGFIGWFSSSQIVSALNWQFDRILLGGYIGKATLGRYSVASDLAVIPTQSLIGPAMQPVMAAFSKINTDAARLQPAFLKAARFAMLISAPACIGISQTADLIVAVLLGPKWYEAATPLKLLALSVITVPYYQTLYALSLAIDRPVVLLRMNLIDLTLRIVLITIGLYLASVEGVAAARFLAAMVMSVFYLLYVRIYVGIAVAKQISNLWKVALSVGVMAVGVFLLRRALVPLDLNASTELFLAAAAGAIFYVGALYGCGVRLVVGRSHLALADHWW